MLQYFTFYIIYEAESYVRVLHMCALRNRFYKVQNPTITERTRFPCF